MSLRGVTLTSGECSGQRIWCTSIGAWDRARLLWRVALPPSDYFHPEFGFLCPTPRFRRRLRVALACLAVAGVGAAVIAAADGPKLDAAVTRADEASIAETVPATSLAPSAAVASRPPVVEGAQIVADNPSCVGDTRSEGNCVSLKLRKPRMVRVATDRPAIAAIPLGRSAAPATSIIDAALPAASAGHQGDAAKSGDAVITAESSPQPQKAVTPKKAQRSASRRNHRRDRDWYTAPSWREVQVDDWGARGYAPRERDYQRGAYGRGSFSPNFW